MRNHAIRLLLYVSLWGAPTAHAAAFDPSDAFKDHISLSAYMRSQGLEPATTDWSLIETMCLDLKTEVDQRLYNYCKFEKARDQRLFHSDFANCQTRAQGEYPSGLLRPQPAAIYHSLDAQGAMRVSELILPPRAYRDVRDARRSAFAACMDAKGWADTQRWQLGRR